MLASTALHVALIVAVLAPARALPRRAAGEVSFAHSEVVERIRYVERTTPHVTSTRRVATQITPQASPRPRAPQLRAASIGELTLRDSLSVPEIDFSVNVARADSVAPSRPRVVDIVKGIVDSVTTAPGREFFAKDEVDKIVRPYPNNAKPVYPWSLRQRGVEASFVAQFIVDSTGRVDEQSIHFQSEANRLFLDAVRQALRRARFYPAEIGGRRVRQLVEQQFSFVLVEGPG